MSALELQDTDLSDTDYSPDDEDENNSYDSCPETNSSYEFEHRLDEYTKRIVRNPAKALADLRGLHATRGAGENEDENQLFMEALSQFIWPLDDPEDSTPRTDHPITKQLVENGLFELIRDVTADESFMSDDLEYACSVISIVIIMRAIVDKSSESPEGSSSSATRRRVILDKAISHILHAIWTARHLWDTTDDNRDSGGLLGWTRKLIMMFLPPIDSLRMSERDCVNYRSIAGFIWATLDEVRDHREVIDANQCFVMALCTFASRGKKGWRGVRPFMVELCDIYGAERVLKRLTSTYIRYKDLGEVSSHAFLYWTPRLLNTPSFYPLYKSTDILAVVRAVYDERIEEVEHRGDLALDVETIDSVVWLAYHLTQNAPFQDGPVQMIKQFGILELIARFVVLHAQHKRELDPGENHPRKVLDVFRGVAEALNMRSGKNELRKKFKLSLRREWYPTLKFIRELEDAGPQREGLLEAWILLGDAMLLNEAQEKKDYEIECKRAAERRCSRSECPYHTKKPPKTRLCMGCAEARYCSKQCQRKDWKEGGHRSRCKRLKDIPRYLIEMQEREDERDSDAPSALPSAGPQRRRLVYQSN